MMDDSEDITVRLLREGENAQRKHLSIGMWKLCSDAAGHIFRLRAATDDAYANGAQAVLQRLWAIRERVPDDPAWGDCEAMVSSRRNQSSR